MTQQDVDDSICRLLERLLFFLSVNKETAPNEYDDLHKLLLNWILCNKPRKRVMSVGKNETINPN